MTPRPLPTQEGTALFDREDRGAEVSECGCYRYSLWRCWDERCQAVLFVMLNPSTADANDDDPTIRKCIGFAKRWGFGGIRVCNLYPWRATNPAELPVGLEVLGEPYANDRALCTAARGAGRIVAAWGSRHGPFHSQRERVLAVLAPYTIHALRLTQDGSPWHPLYVGYDVEPIVYREARPCL